MRVARAACRWKRCCQARRSTEAEDRDVVARILIAALGVDSLGGRAHLAGLLSGLRGLATPHRFEVLLKRSSVPDLAALAGGPVALAPVADGLCQSIPMRLLFDLLLAPLRARRFELFVTLANFGPPWTPVPHLVVQQNAMPFSPEYMDRIHGRLRLEWKLRAWLSVATMRRAALVVTPSQALADLIRHARPELAAKPFAVLPHGLDLSRYASRGRGDEAPSRPFVFLCPTKIEPYKGIELLVAAASGLPHEAREFEVRITASERGWPVDIQRVIDAARGEGPFSRLRFVGPVVAEKMSEAYRAADAVVYPSLCESFGFPLLEAMAAGLPIVAGAPAQLAVDLELCGGAALYYEPKSPAALAGAMDEVRTEAALRASLTRAATERIASRDWSWSAHARHFADLCESAIRGDVPRTRRLGTG